MIKGNKRGSAFTLIEVIITLAIFAVGAVVLSQSFLSGLLSLHSVGKTDSFEEDISFVQQQILSIPDRDIFTRGGSINTLKNGPATWSTQIEETNTNGLFSVTMEIEFEDHKPYPDFLYIFRPKWGDSE